MGHLDELPELALKRIFQFLFAPEENCHGINAIISMRALSNTCTRFREVVETYDWKVKRVHIPASSLQKAMQRESSLLGTLTNFVSTKPKTEYDLSPVLWLSRVNFLRHVEISIDEFTPEEATYLVRKLSDGTKGTVFLISSGWIVDGLVIAQYKKPTIAGLYTKRYARIFILDDGDDIAKVTGENCRFDNSLVTGKITIETSNGKKYGPFGHSGNPNGSERYLVLDGGIDTTPSSLRLQPDRTHQKFLAPIDYDPHWRFRN